MKALEIKDWYFILSHIWFFLEVLAIPHPLMTNQHVELQVGDSCPACLVKGPWAHGNHNLTSALKSPTSLQTKEGVDLYKKGRQWPQLSRHCLWEVMSHCSFPHLKTWPQAGSGEWRKRERQCGFFPLSFLSTACFSVQSSPQGSSGDQGIGLFVNTTGLQAG